MNERILIIKLASIGDVLRTTPMLRVLKKNYPNSYITWVISSTSYRILKNNKFIDRVLIFNLETILKFKVEKFDLIVSLDKAKEAAALATLTKSKKKVGYGLSKEGNIYPFNKETEYEFSLGISDELKFKHNQRTYQEMIFDIIGYEFNKEEYMLPFDEEQENFSKNFLRKNNLTQKDFIVGLNIGCGNLFPQKKWTIEGFSKLAKKLVKEMNAKVMLLAGSGEENRYKKILRKINMPVIETGCDYTLKKFISLINCCGLVVSGDTLAMHIAIALRKKVIALFGPTCSQEIEMYGREIRIVSDIECSPCYRNSCDKKPSCMDKISVRQVMNGIEELKED